MPFRIVSLSQKHRFKQLFQKTSSCSFLPWNPQVAENLWAFQRKFAIFYQHPATIWRIIRFSKCLVTPIYKPLRPFVKREQHQLGDLWKLVANYLLIGMILQVPRYSLQIFTNKTLSGHSAYSKKSLSNQITSTARKHNNSNQTTGTYQL